jgi:HD-GYP domain-containing protein (c-di-GMP phosphodiesterase class II)
MEAAVDDSARYAASPQPPTQSAVEDSAPTLVRRIERLNEIGIALSAEHDPVRLVETILLGAKELTHADGGTVYRVEGDCLEFELVRNDTLHLRLGGSDGLPVTLPPMTLRDEFGNPGSVVALAVIEGRTVNVADAYDNDSQDFTGTRAFDARTGYHSTSLLTVPMRNHEGEITGVLQLLNARHDDGQVRAFTQADQHLVESLASQAATARTKQALILGMERLFEAFIELIADAIDRKSPYTGGHCRRVPVLTSALAEAAAKDAQRPDSALAGFQWHAKDRYELRIAGWLHDTGKVTTPDWVMDKATKLHGLHDHIELIASRFQSIRAANECATWRAIAGGADRASALEALAAFHVRLDDDLAFLRHVNRGQERMGDAEVARIASIGARHWTPPGANAIEPWLTAEEIRCLSIRSGTLLPEERAVINHHITATIQMLERLPFPKHLARVPEYAGGHHERMDGQGYPKGLTGDEMSIPARIMAIADVFEALTAGDRPYKKAMPLSQALAILQRMADTGHIDPNLHAVFLKERVWAAYAREFLPPEQIDLDVA